MISYVAPPVSVAVTVCRIVKPEIEVRSADFAVVSGRVSVTAAGCGRAALSASRRKPPPET